MRNKNSLKPRIPRDKNSQIKDNFWIILGNLGLISHILQVIQCFYLAQIIGHNYY